MEISKDTKEIIEFLDYTTENNLRKRNDLATILEISAKYNEADLLNELILNASSLWNIHRTLKRQANSEISIEKLFKEMQLSVQQTLHLLKQLIGDENKEVLDRFAKIYYAETDGAQKNLIDLVHDINELNNVRKTIKQNQVK